MINHQHPPPVVEVLDMNRRSPRKLYATYFHPWVTLARELGYFAGSWRGVGAIPVEDVWMENWWVVFLSGRDYLAAFWSSENG